MDYFNVIAQAAEELLSDVTAEAVQSAHELLASLDKLQCCPEHAAKVRPQQQTCPACAAQALPIEHHLDQAEPVLPSYLQVASRIHTSLWSR